MKKRAQITIFIIIGLILVSSLIAYVIIKNKTLSNEVSNPKIEPIKEFVEGCLIETANISARQILYNGGFYNLEEAKTIDENVVYFYNSENHLPNLSLFQESISSSVHNNLFFCIKFFSNFPEYNISEELNNISVKIEKDKVLIEANYEIYINLKDESFKLENFKVEYSSGIYNLYNSADSILKDLEKNPNEICFGCLRELAEKEKVVIETVEYENLIIFYIKEINQINSEVLRYSIEW